MADSEGRQSPHLLILWLIGYFGWWSWNIWVLRTKKKAEISVLLPLAVCLRAACNEAIQDVAMSGGNDHAVRLYST